MVNAKIFSSPSQGSKWVADLIVSRINEFAPTPERPFVLGLPTGSSPEQVYAYLVEAYNSGKVTFENVVTFNMDEYVGLSPDNDQSYHYFMYKHFFNHVNVKPENINILDGEAADVDAECARYEEKIRRIGGIHLFMGGIGPNGHIAFNEAGSPADSVTRKIALAESTIAANSRFFSSPEDVPRYALSVGIKTVLSAKEVIILAYGPAKAQAVRGSLLGDVSSECPGSFMRLHGNCTFVLDEAASTEYTRSRQETRL